MADDPIDGDVLPPLWKRVEAEHKRFRGQAADCVDDLMELLGDDKKPVDIGDVPQLLRDMATRIETLLSLAGVVRGK